MTIRPFRWFRIACAFVALVFGLLVLASGLLGPESIVLGGSGHHYYRLNSIPSPYWWLWAGMSLSLAVILFALPRLGRKDRRK